MQLEHADCLGNSSGVVKFLILGFQMSPALKPIVFMFLFTIYFFTVTGNVLIISTISLNKHLHNPMYFFLVILSLVETVYTTAITPTMLGSLFLGGMLISFACCFSQFYFVGLTASNECVLLTLMAYDRYVAICNPLNYTTIMGWRFCAKTVFAACVISIIFAGEVTLPTCTLLFSDWNQIDHFFCDLPPLLKAACSDTSLAEFESFISALIVSSIPCTLIITSYVCIIAAILRIPSASGRHKAFSTCSSHLTVVLTYFGTLIVIYGVPATTFSHNVNKALAVVYTVATPLLNPIIYTLRNKDILDAMEKALKKIL